MLRSPSRHHHCVRVRHRRRRHAAAASAPTAATVAEACSSSSHRHARWVRRRRRQQGRRYRACRRGGRGRCSRSRRGVRSFRGFRWGRSWRRGRGRGSGSGAQRGGHCVADGGCNELVVPQLLLYFVGACPSVGKAVFEPRHFRRQLRLEALSFGSRARGATELGPTVLQRTSLFRKLLVSVLRLRFSLQPQPLQRSALLRKLGLGRTQRSPHRRGHLLCHHLRLRRRRLLAQGLRIRLLLLLLLALPLLRHQQSFPLPRQGCHGRCFLGGSNHSSGFAFLGRFCVRYRLVFGA
mmetsp:Transcript_26058/g.44460  ORF Transcript_26058/g.44460 Transcript_26058/m.44460 type:complete len:294 (+) Transcript_26058:840-1721(+)